MQILGDIFHRNTVYHIGTGAHQRLVTLCRAVIANPHIPAFEHIKLVEQRLAPPAMDLILLFNKLLEIREL